MAVTTFGTNDPSTNKLWSDRLFYETISETWYGKFIGEGDNSLCQLKTDTQKQAGDRITFTLRQLLTGRGRTEGQTLEGNEEALSTSTDSLTINELRHAVRVKNQGSIDQQRVTFNLRTEAKNGLKDWFIERMDTAFFNQLAGNTAASDLAYTGLNTPIAPTSTHRLWGGATTVDTDEEVTSTTQNFTLRLIDAAVLKAKTLGRKIRPLRVNGQPMYVCFIHPGQYYELRGQTTAGQWYDIQQAAMMGGEIEDNPIFKGAAGLYNNTVIHIAEHLPYGVHSSTGDPVTTCRRAVFCGAQAMVMGFGQERSQSSMMGWKEELFDYEHEAGVAINTLFGLKKTTFDSADFAVITISGYSSV